MRAFQIVAVMLVTLIAATAAWSEDGPITQPEGNTHLSTTTTTVTVDYDRINQMIHAAIKDLGGASDPQAIEAIVAKYAAQCATKEDFNGLKGALEASMRSEIAKGQTANAAKLDAMNGRIGTLESRMAALEKQLATTAKTVEEVKAIAQVAADNSAVAATQATEANAHAKAADEALNGMTDKDGNPQGGGLVDKANGIDKKADEIKTSAGNAETGVKDANGKLDLVSTAIEGIKGMVAGIGTSAFLACLFSLLALVVVVILLLVNLDSNKRINAIMENFSIKLPEKPKKEPKTTPPDQPNTAA